MREELLKKREQMQTYIKDHLQSTRDLIKDLAATSEEVSKVADKDLQLKLLKLLKSVDVDLDKNLDSILKFLKEYYEFLETIDKDMSA